jgi:hypothetical protein
MPLSANSGHHSVYSITSSARSISVLGTFSPSVFGLPENEKAAARYHGSQIRAGSSRSVTRDERFRSVPYYLSKKKGLPYAWDITAAVAIKKPPAFGVSSN